MSAIASSRINKSGKKFVPKAAARRAPAAQPTVRKIDDVAVESPATISPQPVRNLPHVDQDIGEARKRSVAPSEDSSIDQRSILNKVVNEAPIPIPTSRPVAIQIPRSRQTSAIPDVADRQSSVTPIISHTTPQLVPEVPDDISPASELKRKLDFEPASSNKRRRASLQEREESPEVGGALAEPVVSGKRKISTRSSRTSQKPAGNELAAGEAQAGTVSARRKGKGHARRTRKSLEDVAADIVAEATGDGRDEDGKARRKKRRPTPEEDEQHEIEPSLATMTDMCKSTKFGKKSEKERELQSADWDDIKKKRKELEEARNAEPRSRARHTKLAPGQVPAGVVRLTKINGEIVAVQDSDFVDNNAAPVDEEVMGPPINEAALHIPPTSGRFGRKKNHLGRNHWDEEMTDLFYRGLRMFGTDFMMISRMFPGMSRRHVKSKFTKEERVNSDGVKQALLGPREAVNLEEVSQLTNTVYEDPAELEKDLEAQRKELEEDHVIEQTDGHFIAPQIQDENAVHETNDSIMPSVETRNTNLSTRERHLIRAAEEVVAAAVKPKKGKRQGTGSKKNAPKKQKPAYVGSEARILGIIGGT